MTVLTVAAELLQFYLFQTMLSFWNLNIKPVDKDNKQILKQQFTLKLKDCPQSDI